MAIEEKRVRRSDIWFAIILFAGFAIIATIDMLIERDTRHATIAEMRRLERVVIGHAYKPLDEGVLETITHHDEEINSLLEITRHNARAIQGIKALMDARRPEMTATKKQAKQTADELRKLINELNSPGRRSSPKAIEPPDKAGGKPQ